MFKAAPANPYDDLVNKATSEDLIAEDWDAVLRICDKVTDEGEAGARNAVSSVMKRLAHRNPNVQSFALELANSIAQNCGRPAHAELGSRAFTGALDRLIRDRTTNPAVKQKATKYVSSWTREFGADPALGVMAELQSGLEQSRLAYESGAGAGVGAAAAAGGGGARTTSGSGSGESEAERRARLEEEELQRVLELSKQDKGGRGATSTGGGSGSGAGPSGSAAAAHGYAAAPTAGAATGGAASSSSGPYPAREPTPPPAPPSKATASRVRAIYPFVTEEKGELPFERGDVIKVIDRMYDEWYTGAVGGRIGIFPISYVEPLPDPTPTELAREAQEEARVFAAQGMIVHLQRLLDGLDPSRGDRVQDVPELDDLYDRAVSLQPQIVALMKKYADQRAELEVIHAGVVKASRQYAQMARQPAPAFAQAPPATVYPQQPQGFPAGVVGVQPYAMPVVAAPSATAAVGGPTDEEQRRAAEEHKQAWDRYWAAQAAAQQQAAQAAAAMHPGQAQPATVGAEDPSAAGAPVQSEEERAKIAKAWEEYYKAMGYPVGGHPQQPQQQQGPVNGSTPGSESRQHSGASNSHHGYAPSAPEPQPAYRGPSAPGQYATYDHARQPSYGAQPSQPGQDPYGGAANHQRPAYQGYPQQAQGAPTGLERQVENLNFQ